MGRALLLAYLLGQFSSAFAEQTSFTITWAITPAPPFHIQNGEFAGQGICDAFVDAVKLRLISVEHVIEIVPGSQIANTAKAKRDLCFPCLIKRQSHPVYLYTERTTWHPPHAIIAKKNKLASWIEHIDGRVAFAELMANEDLRFATPAARAYPPTLQAIIDNNPNQTNYFIVNGDGATVRIMQQLMLGRLDYTLEYPSILNYYKAKYNDLSLNWANTREFGEARVPGAAGCTKNTWGKTAVSLIDQVIPAILQDPSYLDSQKRWTEIESLE